MLPDLPRGEKRSRWSPGGRRLEALLKSGLREENNGDLTSIRVEATDWQDLHAPAATVILWVKTFDLPEALMRLAPLANERTTVLTTQNGVEAPATAARIVPAATVLASRIHGFFELENGILRHVGIPPSLRIGMAYGSGHRAPQGMARMLSQARISATVSPDILGDLWEKMVLAASLGGVAAAAGAAAGQVLDDPLSTKLLEQAIHEVLSVAQARNITLPPDCANQTMRFVRSFPHDATTSMQRDLAASVQSEFDGLTGAIPRLAAESGVTAPIFSLLCDVISSKYLGNNLLPRS